MNTANWYVAHTFPRSEKMVHKRIQQLGVTSFLPTRLEKRQWSDRVKKVELPLFSCYLFVNTLEVYLPSLLEINGLSRFISFNNKFAIVRDQEIELIKKVMIKGVNVAVENNRFKVGQHVKIVAGPFAGSEGVLVKSQGRNRVVLELEDIQYNLSIEVPISALAT